MTVKVNGKEISFPDQQPYLNKDGRTMVPVRFISESLGAKVSWDEKTKTVTITGKDRAGESRTVKLKIGENKAVINGKAVTFDTRAEFKNGRTMVPLRFVSEVLGAKVTWDQNTKTVDINE
ncbi:copper amine oxidase N-terminal domain-containing protein [Biomaibacter acetigenes]|uniref:Copper amine oxidase N-terminal domain-containing protein n=1 Tax=Biomaibacter acetigenes TaxID=2316383 RepID=A0A3G2R7C4_9FIRM|nr:copper amine oxidase N-terminal domain-containing protein [Biomaibacter acetigenes]AYO31275.1 copper amine oxidase N-terminal domain-containing protein [Biomaibacter acetigenes]